jgi:hypothetical protein
LAVIWKHTTFALANKKQQPKQTKDYGKEQFKPARSEESKER